MTETKHTQEQQFKFDAKEKGNNEYSGNGGQPGKKNHQESKEAVLFGSDGKRINAEGDSSFDCKI